MLKAAIRGQLEGLISHNKTRTDYLWKFEELIESNNNRSRNIEQILEDLLAFTETLSEEQHRHVREHLTQARAKVRMAIEEELDSGLPQNYTRELFSSKCSALFEHIYESYYGEGKGVYEGIGA